MNLERARLLSPESADIARDLAQARAAADLPPGEPLAAGTLSQLLRAQQWGQVALAGLALAACSVTMAVWKRAQRRAFVIVASLGAIVAAVGFRASIRAEPSPNLAVVLAPQQPVRVAPAADATVSFRTREGSVVLIERAHRQFSLISAGGRRGWVSSGVVETILPRS